MKNEYRKLISIAIIMLFMVAIFFVNVYAMPPGKSNGNWWSSWWSSWEKHTVNVISKPIELVNTLIAEKEIDKKIEAGKEHAEEFMDKAPLPLKASPEMISYDLSTRSYIQKLENQKEQIKEVREGIKSINKDNPTYTYETKKELDHLLYRPSKK